MLYVVIVYLYRSKFYFIQEVLSSITSKQLTFKCSYCCIIEKGWYKKLNTKLAKLDILENKQYKSYLHDVTHKKNNYTKQLVYETQLQIYSSFITV